MRAIDKIKNHVKEYKFEYIAGATLAAGAVVTVVLFKRAYSDFYTQSQILDFSEKVLATDPSLTAENLRYTIINSKTFLGMVPASIADTQSAAEAFNQHVGPLVFGPAVAFMHNDDFVAVFAL